MVTPSEVPASSYPQDADDQAGRAARLAHPSRIQIVETLLRRQTCIGCDIVVSAPADGVITLARELGYEVHEQPMPREMLYFADEVFFSGTAAEVTPVRSVDRIQIGSGSRGPVTEAVQQSFFGLFNGRTRDQWGWLQPLEAPAAPMASVAV